MKATLLAQLLLGGGIFLLVVSFIWPSLVGGRRAWNDDMAKMYAVASANYHDALHTRVHPRDGHRHGESAPDLARAREEFVEQQELLSAAQNRGEFSAAVCRWLGIIGAASGVVLLIVRKQAAS